jgi:hypothetical protein
MDFEALREGAALAAVRHLRYITMISFEVWGHC